MDDSDEEVKMVKRPRHRVRFRIMEDDGDDDLSVDLQPSADSSQEAKYVTHQSNSAQSIRRGGHAFCQYLYDVPSDDVPAANPGPVKDGTPVDTSSVSTPKTAGGGVYHVEPSRCPPNERPGLLYFYGNGIQLADTQTYPRPVHIALNGKLHGLMHLEDSGRSIRYHSRYRNISSYYDEMGMKITFGSLSIHEYKYILKHNWLFFVNEFETEFGRERIPLILRRKIDRSRKLLNMSPVDWPLVHSVDRYGRLYQSEQR